MIMMFQKLFEERENLQYINEDNFYHPSNSDRDIIDKFEVINSFINFMNLKSFSNIKEKLSSKFTRSFNIVIEFSRPQMNINDFSEIIKLTENIDHSFKI